MRIKCLFGFHKLKLTTILSHEYKLCEYCNYTEKHFLHGFSKIKRSKIIYPDSLFMKTYQIDFQYFLMYTRHESRVVAANTIEEAIAWFHKIIGMTKGVIEITKITKL